MLRRSLLQLMAIGTGFDGHQQDVDYGGQALRDVSSIYFTDGTTQTTAASGNGGSSTSSGSSALVNSSWGTVYDATDAGVDQAIRDLNATAKQEWIRIPPGTFRIETPWMLEVAMVMVAIIVLVIIFYTILYGPRSAVR